jgi:GAF domain-containing protein
MAERELAMLDTFVELADSLASDYEVNEFLHTLVERCAEIFRVTTAGVMLETSKGVLQLAVALSPEMEDLEQAEVDNEDGPCHEAYRTGHPVVANDLDHSDVAERWPTVVDRMRQMGLRAVYAFPLRLRDDRIGALNLYRDEPGEFAEADIRRAQAFADVAAIGVIQERKVTNAEQRAEQLQKALDSRIVIEQAKGIVSAERNVPLEEAFDVIRHHARSNSRTIHDVARAVVDHGSTAIEGSSIRRPRAQ